MQKLTKLTRSHRFIKFIKLNTKSFTDTDEGFYFEMNDKIQKKFDEYDTLIDNLNTIKKSHHSRIWCGMKIGPNGCEIPTYRLLPYIIQASTHYFRVKSKKDKHDHWLGYITEINSSENIEWVSSGKWGYDYTVKINGEEKTLSTHPSDSPIDWVYDPKEVIRLLQEDGVELSTNLSKLYPKGWKFSEYPNEILPELSIEISNH